MNEKITNAVTSLGHCCVFRFLADHPQKRYPHDKLAEMLTLGLSTIEYNRRKFRNGEMKPCEQCAHRR
jgi:hypothetical protein